MLYTVFTDFVAEPKYKYWAAWVGIVLYAIAILFNLIFVIIEIINRVWLLIKYICRVVTRLCTAKHVPAEGEIKIIPIDILAETPKDSEEPSSFSSSSSSSSSGESDLTEKATPFRLAYMPVQPNKKKDLTIV